MRNKIVISTSLCLFLLFTISCEYRDIVKADNDFAKGMSTVQTIVMAAYDNNPKLIDKALKDKIMTVCLKVDVTGKQIHDIIASVGKITPAERVKLLNLIQIISDDLKPQTLIFIADITDEKTKLNIELGFAFARSAISTMKVILMK